MLKAGFARVDITPPLGTYLDGYFSIRPMSGVLDPLELNAIALNDGEKTVVMIAADIIGIAMADVKYIKKKMFERLALPEECVLLHAIHQHTTLRLDDKAVPDRQPAAYIELLYTKFVDVAQMAIDDMKDSVLSSGEKETAEPIAFVRRYMLDDGRAVTNPQANEVPHIVSRLAEADNTVRLLRFKRKDAKDIALVNFSTHPDVVAGYKASADWPGFTRRFVEGDNSDVNCIFFTGAQGDSNHLDYIKGTKTGYEHSRCMGRIVADAVAEIWDKTTERRADKLFASVSVIYNKSNTEGEEKYEEAVAFEKARAEKTLGYNPTIEEMAYARRIINIRESMTIYRPIPVTVIGIGEVIIAGFAGEAFTEYGAAVRDAANGKFALTFVLTNGSQGYLPSAEAFAQGGYEAKSSHFTPELESQVIAEVKRLIDMI